MFDNSRWNLVGLFAFIALVIFDQSNCGTYAIQLVTIGNDIVIEMRKINLYNNV